MQLELNQLIEAIKADFAEWTAQSGIMDTDRLNEFGAGLSITEGKKYIKIISDGSVWGFIVAVDNDAKFQRGDILKPASWSAPARNQARGNVFTGYDIQWTGPRYL